VTRTILIHLHVEASDADTRDPDEIADAVGEALGFVQAQDPEANADLSGLTFAIPLVDELHARP
jgi:hypothetical protein